MILKLSIMKVRVVECQVVTTDKGRLHCTKDELLKQFNKSLVKFNKLSQELHEAKDNLK